MDKKKLIEVALPLGAIEKVERRRYVSSYTQATVHIRTGTGLP
jgi:hypothetical protein